MVPLHPLRSFVVSGQRREGGDEVGTAAVATTKEPGTVSVNRE